MALRQLYTVQQCPNLCRQFPTAGAIQTFLQQLRFHSTIETTRAAAQSLQATPGTTWLKLYVLYRLMGHPEPIGYQAHKAHARPTLCKQLHTFRRTVRQITMLTMVEHYRRYFTGAMGKGQPLRGLGISTCLAILPMQLCLEATTQLRVAQEIIRSQHRLTQAMAAKALAQGKLVPLRRLQLKGRVQWARSLRPISQPIFPPTPDSQPHTPTHQAQPPMHQQQEGPAHTPPPEVVLLQCPTCPHWADGTWAAFALDNLDGRTWCKKCHRSRFVRLWKCPCGLPWATCPNHSGEPHRLRQAKAKAHHHQPTAEPTPHHHQPTPEPTPRRRSKRILGQGQDAQLSDWLDRPAPQHKRAKHQPVEIELEPEAPTTAKPYLLGPKLRAKFPHIVGSPAQPQPHHYNTLAAYSTAGSSTDHPTTSGHTSGAPHPPATAARSQGMHDPNSGGQRSGVSRPSAAECPRRTGLGTGLN